MRLPQLRNLSAFRERGITFRLSLAILAVVTWAVLLTGGIGLYTFRASIQQNNLQQVEESKRALDRAIDAAARQNLALAHALAEQSAVQELMRRRDRVGLYNLLKPIYLRLSAEHDVENMHLHTERLITVLRMHQPRNFGDDLSGFRKILVDVNQTLKPRFGLEEGINGIPIRGVVPVITADGVHVGSLEVGTFIRPAFLRRTAPQGTHYTVLMQRGRSFEIYTSSLEQRVRVLSESQLQEALAGRIFPMSGQCPVLSGSCLVAAEPLKDYAGRPIGAVEVILDSSPLDAAYRSLWIYLAVGFWLLLIGGFVTALWVGRRFAAPIHRLTLAAQQLAQRNLDVAIPHTAQHDEIGTLAAALEVFRQDSRALREAEQRSRVNEQRLQVALSVVDIAVFNQDLGLRYTWMYQPQLGFSSNQVVGKTDADLLPPEAARRVTELKRRALTTKTGLRETVPVPAQDKTHLYDLTVEPILNERGEVTGITGASLDITEQRQRDELLLQTQGQLQAAIESIPACFWMYDPEGRLVHWNSHVDTVFPGLTEKLHLGQSFLDVTGIVARAWIDETDEVREAWAANFVEQFRNPPSRSEFPIRDGRTLRGLDWRTTDGSTVILLFDITEEKNKEQQLRQAQQRLFAAIDALPAAFLLWNAESRLVLWNSHVAKLYNPSIYARLREGMTYEEFARIANELMGGTEEERENAYRQRVQQFHSAPSTAELRLEDGRTLQMADLLTPDGSTVSLRFDISDARKRDEELVQSRKMDSLGKLTGGVAHDFNNLLQVISGNAELLLQDFPKQGDIHETLQLIKDAANRGAGLTSRLLAYSRKQALRPEPIEVNRLVIRLSEMLRRTLGEHIQIATVLGEGLWPIFADASQLETAILNLAVNARDAMPAGGKLTIETANARLDDDYAAQHPEVKPGRYVMLAVSDSGEGMTRNTVERAFEPFFTTKDIGKGTGLGLSMVYGFVKQSGGHVKIYSEPGKGTAVKIYLPHDESETDEQAAAPATNTLPSGSETILVVEDEQMVRRTVTAQLRRLGYVVHEAADAASALELLAGPTPIDLLFTDLVMPGGIMGEELARRGREARPRLRVLFTSGYTENAVVHQEILGAEVQILQKPYTRELLATKIRTVLGPAS